VGGWAAGGAAAVGTGSVEWRTASLRRSREGVGVTAAVRHSGGGGAGGLAGAPLTNIKP